MLNEEQIKNIPSELKDCPQWVAWKLVPKSNKKSDKIPINPETGKYDSATDPSIYRSFDEALKLSEKYSGVGFCFTENDPFSGVDLDDCLKNGTLLDNPQKVFSKLNSYCEISPSGKGVKIFLKGWLPGPNKNTSLIIFIISAKFIATFYLLLYYFLTDAILTILLSGIADGLMGFAVLLLWRSTREVRNG